MTRPLNHDPRPQLLTKRRPTCGRRLCRPVLYLLSTAQSHPHRVDCRSPFVPPTKSHRRGARQHHLLLASLTPCGKCTVAILTGDCDVRIVCRRPGHQYLPHYNSRRSGLHRPNDDPHACCLGEWVPAHSQHALRVRHPTTTSRIKPWRW